MNQQQNPTSFLQSNPLGELIAKLLVLEALLVIYVWMFLVPVTVMSWMILAISVWIIIRSIGWLGGHWYSWAITILCLGCSLAICFRPPAGAPDWLNASPFSAAFVSVVVLLIAILDLRVLLRKSS